MLEGRRGREWYRGKEGGGRVRERERERGEVGGGGGKDICVCRYVGR